MKFSELINCPVQADWYSLAKQLPDNSAQMAITSPPYYGKRFYPMEPQIFDSVPGCEHDWLEGFVCPTKMGTVGSTEVVKYQSLVEQDTPPPTAFCVHCGAWRGWLGLEPFLELYIQHLIMALRPLKTILRHGFKGDLKRTNGWLALNIGDSYAGSGKGAWKNKDLQKEVYVPDSDDPIMAMPKIPAGFKPGDLMMVPHRVAIALQMDGWTIRKDNVWWKKSPPPDSAQTRTVSEHEYIFQCNVDQYCYFDMDAIRVPYAASSLDRYNYSFNKSAASEASDNPAIKIDGKIEMNPQGRSHGSVWHLGTANTKGDHYATYPEELVRVPLLAGTSPKACADCGAPYLRQVVKKHHLEAAKKTMGSDAWGGYEGKSSKDPGGQKPNSIKANILKGLRYRETIGWKKPCKCPPSLDRKCIVIDPFGGTFTTGLIALKNGRDFISCDAVAKYVDIGKKRVADYASQTEVETW